MSTINQCVEASYNWGRRRHWTTAKSENGPESATQAKPVTGPSAVTLQNETINGIPVLRCSGRIVYGPESECLFGAIREKLQSFPALILDFRRVTTIDARGIGALLTLHALARSKNGSIRLVHVNERVGRVLRVTNLFGLFELYDSEAVAALAK
jgi:anti-anti-sigma factor